MKGIIRRWARRRRLAVSEGSHAGWSLYDTGAQFIIESRGLNTPTIKLVFAYSKDFHKYHAMRGKATAFARAAFVYCRLTKQRPAGSDAKPYGSALLSLKSSSW